jgi:hypothetical protein
MEYQASGITVIEILLLAIVLGGFGLVIYQVVRKPLPLTEFLQTLVGTFAVLGTIAFAALYIFGVIVAAYQDGTIYLKFRDHLPAMIGLPFAALAALALVSGLEMKSGSIELEVLGLKFKGAAAPIVFWVFVFLAISLAVKLLWGLQ